MKYFLDSCALRYLLGYYKVEAVKEEFKFNLDKFKKDILCGEIVTDAMVVFEILNNCQNVKQFFKDIKNYDSSIYMKFYKNKSDLKYFFQKARDKDEYRRFFYKIASLSLKNYVIQLSKAIFYLFSYFIGIIELNNGFRQDKNEYIIFSRKVSDILIHARRHVEKVLYAKFFSLVRKNSFNEKNAQAEFTFVINKVGYYMNMLPTKNIDMDSFYKLLNDIKDRIIAEKFETTYNGNFENLNKLQKKLPKQKINVNKIVNIYVINDGEVLSHFLNITLNKMFVRKSKNFKLNDIKDSLIAENYLSYINEKNDQETIFVTFDTNFKLELSKINNSYIQKSMNYVNSLYK